MVYIKPSPITGLIVDLKIKANSCLLNAENLIMCGLPNAVVAYEKYHCCLNGLGLSQD
jgi:hypothetical protein